MECGSSHDVSGVESPRFSHDEGDLVLVKWNDGMVYFAKIKRIDNRKKLCVVMFDDRSTDRADFSQIHSVDETTTDIICIKCKKDDSESPNEIVLCDSCGIGFHQKCHSPPIPASAVELDTPWHCVYCLKHSKNPYLTESIDVMQSLFEEECAEDDEIAYKQVPYSPVKVKIEKDSDAEDYMESQSMQQQQYPSPPLIAFQKKRKVGRPRLHESTKKHNKMKPLEVLRRKLAKTNTGRASATRASNWRKRHHSKDIQSPSVQSVKITDHTPTEACTVSVRNVSPDASSVTSTKPNDSSDTECFELHNAGSVNDDDSICPPASKRPRSLRVSLTLPPSVETSPSLIKTSTSPSASDKVIDEQWDIDNAATIEHNSEKEMDACTANDKHMECDEMSVQEQIARSTSNSEPSTSNDDQSANTELTGPPPLKSELEKTASTPSLAALADIQQRDIPPLYSATANEFTPPPLNADSSNVVNSSTASIAMEDDDDVIIIEEKCNKVAPAVPSNTDTVQSDTAESSTATTKISSSESLVKVAAGVTTLKPNKPKRPSIIQEPLVSPPPGATTQSPLEVLQNQIRQTTSHRQQNKTRKPSMHMEWKYPHVSRPLSCSTNVSSSPVQQRVILPKPVTTVPLSHGVGTAHTVVTTPVVTALSPTLGNTSKNTVTKAVSNIQPSLESNRSRIIAPPLENQEITSVQKQMQPMKIIQQQQPSAHYIHVDNISKGPLVIANQPQPVMTVAPTGEITKLYTLVHQGTQTNNDSIITYSPTGNGSDTVIVPTQPVVITQQIPNSNNQSTSLVCTPMQQQTLLSDNQAVSCYVMELPTQGSIDQQQAQQQLTVNTTKPYAVVNAIPTNRHSIQSPPPTVPIQNTFKIVNTNNGKNNKAPLSQSTPRTDQLISTRAYQNEAGLDKNVREQTASELANHLHAIRNRNIKAFDNLTESDLTEIFQSAYRQFQENAKSYNQQQQQSRPRLLPTSQLQQQQKIRSPNVQVVSNSLVPVQSRANNNNMIVRPKPQRLYTPPTKHHQVQQRIVSPPLEYSLPAAHTPQTAIQTHQQASTATVTPAAPNHSRHTTTWSSGVDLLHRQQQQKKHQVYTSGLFVPPTEELAASLQKHGQQQNSVQLQLHHQQPQPLRQQQQIQYSNTAAVVSTHRTAMTSNPIAVQVVNNSHSTYESPTTAVISNPISISKHSSDISHDHVNTPVNNKPSTPDNTTPINTIATTNTVTAATKRATTATGAAKRKERSDLQRICIICSKDATYLCSGCHNEWYCGRACQLKAWDKHSEFCRT